MKTAEEIARYWTGETPDLALNITWQHIREGLQKDIEDFATQVAQDALNRAAENADFYMSLPPKEYYTSEQLKESITQTEIVLS